MSGRRITVDPDLVSKCGLYCGTCPAYLKQKCQGCEKNNKATWCKTRQCAMRHDYASCADCIECIDPRRCKTFYNIIARIIGWIFGSDRVRGIAFIRANGREAYAQEMILQKRHAFKLKRF